MHTNLSCRLLDKDLSRRLPRWTAESTALHPFCRGAWQLAASPIPLIEVHLLFSLQWMDKAVSAEDINNQIGSTARICSFDSWHFVTQFDIFDHSKNKEKYYCTRWMVDSLVRKSIEVFCEHPSTTPHRTCNPKCVLPTSQNICLLLNFNLLKWKMITLWREIRMHSNYSSKSC